MRKGRISKQSLLYIHLALTELKDELEEINMGLTFKENEEMIKCLNFVLIYIEEKVENML